MQSIEIAVSLVKQAIDQDRRKNYPEAARCYREALNLFDNASKSKGLNKSVKQAIAVKCNQYENRLGKLEKFLFESKDLTHTLFKDVVEYQYHNKRPDSQSSFSDESISSENWKGLKNCSLFRQGIQQIERGKKKDQREDYSQALDFYENGMMLLIRATESNIEEETPENTEHLRFKCLLIHERIEELKNHLDLGRSIKPINDSLNTIEYSLGHQNVSSQANSPEPDTENEENILQSDELGSVHSLYSKVIVEESEEEPNKSMHSHSAMDNSILRNNDTPQSIPLADLDGELTLSTQSISSLKSSQSIKSYCSSIKGLNYSNVLNNSTYGEADFNITELTVANSILNQEDYILDDPTTTPTSIRTEPVLYETEPVLYETEPVLCETEPVSGTTRSTSRTSSSTDSGIISPQKLDSDQDFLRSRHQSSNCTNDDQDEALLLEVHRSGDGTPVIDPSPSRTTPPSVRISPSASMKRKATLKAMENEIDVLSQDVVDTVATTSVVKVKAETYSKSTSSSLKMSDQYIPPGAMARQFEDLDEDREFNQGCYYFVACLDSLWIL